MVFKDSILVSVIVTVYKVADYLEQCLQSIINQEYRNIEIVIIDDGSPDNSIGICDRFKKIDNRVIVIHKENEGSVFARRDGLFNSHGKYVLFVDGDDYLDPYYVSNLVLEAEESKADVVVDSFLVSYSEKEFEERIIHKPGIYRGDKLSQIKQRMIFSGRYFVFGINPALWNKLFIREKLLNYYHNVPKQISLGDDFAVSMPYLLNAGCISIIDSDAYYHYRQHDDSMVKSYDSMLIQKIENLMVYLNGNEILSHYKLQLNYYYSWLLICCLKNESEQYKSITLLANAIEQTINRFSGFVSITSLHDLDSKYGFLFSLVKRKCWKTLALCLLMRKQWKALKKVKLLISNIFIP